MPVTVGFSKKNNRFQIYGISGTTQRITSFNLFSILNAQKTERPYDLAWAEKELEKSRKDREKYVDIGFMTGKQTESVLSG